MMSSRVAAFAIALLAVADPGITASRSSRPLVSILGDSARLAERVERALARKFTPVRGALPAAAATVMVGDALPDETNSLGRPVLAVVPTHEASSVRIVGLTAPATSPINARIPVEATIAVTGARGRKVLVELRAGAAVVDSKSASMSVDSGTVRTTLYEVAATTGPQLLTATARFEASPVADSASITVDSREERLAVLFFDPQASWQSTFVRRAVEEDPRFAVTHRVLTSRGLSNTTGSAPLSLRDAQLLTPYSTIVVGSPERLNEAEVAGLESFMRRRGGRVVLLMDRRAASAIDRLTESVNWRATRFSSARTLRNTSLTDSLLAQEIAWPATMPSGSTSLVESSDSARRSVIWSVPVGAGRLLVSGALDAWQHRDASFSAFWTNTIAELAATAPSPVEISLSRRSVVPGQETEVHVWIRDVALSNASTRSASVSAAIVATTDTSFVRLWPEQSPGTYFARIVAPRVSGTYRVIASSGSDRAEAALVVDASARTAASDERHLIDAFASSRGGSVVPEIDLERLPAVLSSAIQSASRVETWHPMRSPWWIVPFALLLGAEWWWRRRRGLA